MITYGVGDEVTLIEGITGTVLELLEGAYVVRTWRGIEFVNAQNVQPWPAEAP